MNHIFNIYILTFIIFLLLINYKKQLDKKRENFDTSSNLVTDETIKAIFNDIFKVEIENMDLSKVNNINKSGNIYTNGKTNFPSGWSGYRTWDVYSSGSIGLGDDYCNIKVNMNNSGAASFGNGAFEITADGQVIFRQPGNPGRFCKIYFDGSTLKFETHLGNTIDFQGEQCTGNMGLKYKGGRRYINQV